MTLSGRLTDANTLLTAWISENTSFSVSTICVPSLAISKYLPVDTAATLLSNAVHPGPWPLVVLLMSMV